MDKEAGKRAVAVAAAQLVQNGMTVGIGSGTTAYHFQAALAEHIEREGWEVRVVAPSTLSEAHATRLGLKIVPLTRGVTLDLAVDGADEVSPEFSLIKGGGGALVREKLVAAAAHQFIVIADASKRLPRLGAFPLPVAIFPFGWEQTVDRLEAAFAVPITMRGGSENPFRSDDGLYIADIHFGTIPDPVALQAQLRSIVGVAETGLFIGMTHRVLFGHADGTVEEISL